MTPDLDAIEARLNAVPYRDMLVAVAPAAGSTETAAEYMAGALQSDGPIWVVWSPAEDDSAPYLVNAITGDGPTSEATADLIAHAPTDLAALLDEVERLRAVAEAAHRMAFSVFAQDKIIYPDQARRLTAPLRNALDAWRGGEG